MTTSETTEQGGAGTAEAERSIRVLLVDDQDLVRAGFRIILESEPGIEVVGEASTGLEAIARAGSLRPDVICMDVQMPGMDGLEATRLIAADRGITAGILILTTFDRDDFLFEALKSGASGFLLKNASPEDLIEAVQVIARGDALLSPDITRRVIAQFGSLAVGEIGAVPGAGPLAAAGLAAASMTGQTDAGATGASHYAAPVDAVIESLDEALARGDGLTIDTSVAVVADQAPIAPELDELTDREREVLDFLARGWSNAEIAAELFLGEATIKTHVSKVLMKLGLRDRIQAVVFAYEHGIAVPGAGTDTGTE